MDNRSHEVTEEAERRLYKARLWNGQPVAIGTLWLRNLTATLAEGTGNGELVPAQAARHVSRTWSEAPAHRSRDKAHPSAAFEAIRLA